MLSLKQLQDAKECGNREYGYKCENCSFGLTVETEWGEIERCTLSPELMAQTALAYRDMLIRIQHSSSDEADNACCPICGMTEGKHAKGCELAALIKEE
jgi:hypothetical protein